MRARCLSVVRSTRRHEITDRFLAALERRQREAEQDPESHRGKLH
jgi:hypothetical protein